MKARHYLSIAALLLLSSSLSSAFSLSMMSATPKSTLFDLPVSNNGARCRLILYKKQIPAEEVKIASPMDVGGLKTPEYLAMNPQGKMPLLSVTNGMNIPESDTICRYLMSTYADKGPDFLPNDPKSNLIARIHDMYITTIQGCLYKPSPPFGVYGTRSDAIEELKKQLKVVDDLIDDPKDGIYLCGGDVSLADATLFPTMIFVKEMLPKFGIPVEKALPPKISRWYEAVRENDEDFAKVYDEVSHVKIKSFQ